MSKQHFQQLYHTFFQNQNMNTPRKIGPLQMAIYKDHIPPKHSYSQLFLKILRFFNFFSFFFGNVFSLLVFLIFFSFPLFFFFFPWKKMNEWHVQEQYNSISKWFQCYIPKYNQNQHQLYKIPKSYTPNNEVLPHKPWLKGRKCV